MTRRILTATGIGLVALLVAVSLLLVVLVGTQSGSRLLWGGASGAVAGLSADRIEGRLAGPLSLQGVRFETDSLRLTIGSVRLDWSPSRLLSREVLLEGLHLEDVVYTQLKAAPPPEDSEPFSLPEQLSLPVALELRDITLRSFEYRAAADAEPVRVDEAALAGSFRGTDLSIDHLSAHGPLFRVESSASARTEGDYPLSASLDWQAMLPELAPLSAELSVDGDMASLRVRHTIAAPYNASQEVELRDVLGEPYLDALTTFRDTQLQAIADTLPASSVSGTLSAKGSVADLGYRADLNMDSADFGALSLLARGGFSDQVVAIEQLLLRREPGAGKLEVAGRAILSGPVPTFELQGDWRELRWPLAGEPRIISDTGRFTLDGSAEDYSATLRTALSVPGQTDGQLTLSGHGDSGAFELAELELALMEGYLSGQGQLQWSPRVSGSLTLDGEGLNPAVLAPDFPGNLRIVVRAAGAVSDGAATADIETLSINGTFRGQPLDVEVKGGFQNERLNLDTLNVESGETRISARGSAGDSLDLQWTIDSPDLGDLLPGASGSIAGAGGIAGSPSMPAVHGALEGDAIVYADYGLEKLSLELDVDLGREAPSRLDLVIDQALLGGVEVSRLQLSGEGNRSDHRLNLQLDSAEGAAELSLRGNLADAAWDGALTDGELRYGQLAGWTLADAQAVQLSAGVQELSRGCWRSGDARLCLQGRRDDGELNATLGLNAFGLEYLRPMIPGALSLAGTLEAQAGFRQEAGSAPSLELTLAADGVELRTGESADQPDELLLGLQTSEISVNYGDAGLLARISMPFTGGGGIDATARVEAGSDSLAERPLQGDVALALEDIGFLTSLSPEIEQATGALSGDLELSGTLARPMPVGELKLAGGSLELAAPGLNISDIGVRVSSSGGAAFDFDGQATSGKGMLQLGGSATLDGARTTVDLDIQGDSFEIVNTVDARAFVSPDLQIAIRETGIDISGEVVVPRAEITPKELPQSVVTASSDEVIVSNEPDGGAAAAAQRELSAKVRIVLGDRVSVDGFGLKGRLAGGLTVNQSPGQPTLGSGEVSIVDGEYRAYGQGLVIDKGRILFAGGPISQPGINVRALRRPAEGIVVGVSARGPLQDPDFSVFSEPAMTQSEQLSWLVLGRPLDGASEGESNMIAQAALALGLKGGNFLADRLGGGLGVDTVGIETGSGEAGAASDVNQAAFVIGKYLSPDLFVSYGIGLFDSISTVRLEYSLTDHWKVSTESSTLASGGDVTYTIER